MYLDLRLKELRSAKGVTQKQVATGINCSTVTYGRYENGIRQPSMETLVRLAEYYNVSLDYIYGRGPMPESALSDDEFRLIQLLRQAPPAIRENFLAFASFSVQKREALE